MMHQTQSGIPAVLGSVDWFSSTIQTGFPSPIPSKNRLACSGFSNSSHPHRQHSSFTSLLLVKVNLFVREGSIVFVPFGTLLSFSCRYRENQNQPPFVGPIPINRSKWPLQTRPPTQNLIEIDKPYAKQHTIVTTS
jgi:hypothetical protein